MAFDLQRFRAAALAPRQARMPVPDLAHWFDGEPAFVVRGLTGEEIARANDANNRIAMYRAAVEALTSAAHSEQADALKAMMGVTDVPEDLAKRFDHLVYGCVDPALSREDAIRLFQFYPVVGYQISNKILELTGLGPDLGKAPRSTDAPTL